MIVFRPISSREVAHFVAWFHKELVVFPASLFGSRLAAAWPFRDEIAGDQFQHLINECLLLPGRLASGRNKPRPMAEGIKSPLEAQARKGHMMEVGAALHEAAHEIVGDLVHEHL